MDRLCGPIWQTILLIACNISLLILGHLFWLFEKIDSEFLIFLIDILLIIVILYFILKTNGSRGIASKTKIVPPERQAKRFTDDKFISHWKNHFLDYNIKLPLDRVAYLKAKYNIGPFSLHPFAPEISLSFLKRLALTRQRNQFEENECHPICVITQFSEAYVQHKALLYYVQGIKSVDFMYQVTRLNDYVLRPSLAAIQPFRSSSLKEEEEELHSDSVVFEFENWESSEERKEEFLKQIEKSKKILENVQNVFNLLNQQKKDQRIRRHECDSTELASELQECDTFF